MIGKAGAKLNKKKIILKLIMKKRNILITIYVLIKKKDN